jgi:hypothetical protein
LWRGVAPNRFSRSRTIWGAKAWTWNYNREVQNDSWHGRASMTFLNYWYVNGGGLVWRRALDDRLTRGGPTTIAPAGSFSSINAGTDPRRWFSVQANIERSASDEGGWSNDAILTFSIKPSSMVTISIGPQWKRSRAEAQYVTTVDDATALATHGQRYVFGTLDQTEISMTTRVNLILTPTVSVQIFAQPLLSGGDYINFKELARPRTFEFLQYGSAGRSLDFDAVANTYSVDPDGGAASSFSFDNPDFNLKSLKLNAVFRWEIKSGSNFYAVWTRQQEDERDPGHFVFGRDTGRLFGAPGDDVFLVKIAYWIGR